jgi:protein SCO1/2
MRWLILILVLLAPATGALAARAYDAPGTPRANELPEAVRDIGIDEHLGARLPLDATFRDEQGKAVKLQDYFSGSRPVVIQLGYFGCPMLCGLVSKGMMESMRELDMDIGKELHVIYLSFDHRETSELAAAKKRNYLKVYGRQGAENGWHFLTGTESEILRVTQATGFKFKWDEAGKQYAHAAAIIISTPDGRVSRYLYGVKYEPRTLRLSLVEASEGKLGSTMDQVTLFCFHYDPASRSYVLSAMNLMRVAGGLTVLILALVIWRMQQRRRRAQLTLATGEN